jgi:hypothetical protein
MHPYERWTIPRLRQRAEVDCLRDLRPPIGNSSLGSTATRAYWVCLSSLPERCHQDEGWRLKLRSIPRIGKHGVLLPWASLASPRPTLRLFKSASIGLRRRVRSTAVKAESSVFWRERREHQRSVVLSNRSMTAWIWTARAPTVSGANGAGRARQEANRTWFTDADTWLVTTCSTSSPCPDLNRAGSAISCSANPLELHWPERLRAPLRTC